MHILYLSFYDDSFFSHLIYSLEVSRVIHIGDAVLEQMNLETGLEQVLACVADAIFGGDTADMHISSVQELQDFSKSLSCVVDAFES